MTILLRVLLVCGCVVLMGGIPREARAFLLGELQLLSKPDQPLRAEAVITVEPGEEIVSVEMGGPPDYQLLSLPRKPAVEGITAQLKQQDGRLLVDVHSSTPLRERDFHVVLRVSSNQHTYFPFFRVQLSAAGARKGGAQQPATRTDRPDPAKQEKAYGPVRKKEGLGDVARRFHKGGSLALAQVEVAIWQRNPDRFIRNNMNGLKAGSKLVIPSQEEMARIDKQLAADLQTSHAEEWKKPIKERKQMASLIPAAAVASSPVAQEKEGQAGQQETPPTQEAAKEPAKEVAKEPAKEETKEPAKEAGKEPAKEVAKELAKEAGKELAQGKSEELGKEQVKVESGALKAILVQLQVITRVLENHHERQESLEKRVIALEKSQEQRDVLEKRVSTLERAMKEWNFLTKERGDGPAGGTGGGVPVAVTPAPKGTP